MTRILVIDDQAPAQFGTEVEICDRFTVALNRLQTPENYRRVICDISLYHKIIDSERSMLLPVLSEMKTLSERARLIRKRFTPWITKRLVSRLYFFEYDDPSKLEKHFDYLFGEFDNQSIVTLPFLAVLLKCREVGIPVTVFTKDLGHGWAGLKFAMETELLDIESVEESFAYLEAHLDSPPSVFLSTDRTLAIADKKPMENWSSLIGRLL